MWGFFALVSTFGAPLNFMRRIELTMKGVKENPGPSDWTMRQEDIGTYSRPSALERDMWAGSRVMLDADIWGSIREDLSRDRPRYVPPGLDERREHILGSRWARTPIEGSYGHARWDDGQTMGYETRRTGGLRT